MYDYHNRLLRRKDEFFVHDGWQIMLVLDSQGNVKDRFFWGAKQDELLCENDNWTLCDHLGTVRKIVDPLGNSVSHLEYNAFGKLLNVSGMKPLFRYTGKLFDDITGLQWNINRWYDAKVGRWCSEDPIGFTASDINWMRYAGNNTLSLIDPSGLVENKVQFRGFSLTNSYSYDGTNYTCALNNPGEILPGNIPLGWNLEVTVKWGYNVIVTAKKDSTLGCWSPRFAIKGLVVIIKRPSDNIIVYSPPNYTNMNIWNAQRFEFLSNGYTFASSHDAFVIACDNHELNHYNTFVDALGIIIDGLTRAESLHFMTYSQVIDYGNKAKSEASRVESETIQWNYWLDTNVHWNRDSFLDPHSHPFEEPFNLPMP